MKAGILCYRSCISLGLHVNPLRKKKKVLALDGGTKLVPETDTKTEFKKGVMYRINEGTVNDNDEHMTYREAAIVALIITLSQIFASFLTLYDWSKLTANPSAFLFDLFKFAGASFFLTFMSLSGIAKYLSK